MSIQHKKKIYKLEHFNIVRNRKIGDWTLVSPIGQGGNGSVWKCRNSAKEEYAIKFLKWGRGDAYQRFYDEVKTLEQNQMVAGMMPIIDRNIPSRWGNYDYKTPIYYVMPLAQSVERVIEASSTDEKIQMVQDLLNMLVELHKQGIAHRDIKPANILFYNDHYVFSDFGLVYFFRKPRVTPKRTKLGARWTMSPQMERDASTADAFKGDVYSMAKTIWMIFTGDILGFEGQYVRNSSISLTNYIYDKYLTPLEELLVRCTDHTEHLRPSALEMLEGFNNWLSCNREWDIANRLEWLEVQKNLFPFITPKHCEWTNLNDIIAVLNELGKYNSLNHLFFPDGGGLDLTGAKLSNEFMSIELQFESLVYIVRPEKLTFDSFGNYCSWNYFTLVSLPIPAMTPDYPKEYYSEAFTEFGFLDYQAPELMGQMSKQEIIDRKARTIVRYLRGNFVIFMKSSIYNNFICRYKGEHEIDGPERFNAGIQILANKFKNLTTRDLLEMGNRSNKD